MPQPTLSVVVPCYNEAGNLETLVERLHEAELALDVPLEIVLVDDGSADATAAEIRLLADRDHSVVGAFHDVNRGIAAGWTTGTDTAGGDYVALLDADLQYDPLDLGRLWRELRHSGATVVQGWRVYRPGFQSPLRYGMSVTFSGLLQLGFGVRLRDIKSDYLICPRDLLLQALEDAERFRFFQHYLTVALVKRGATIRQIPVEFGDRQVGESFIQFPFRFATAAIFELPRAIRYYQWVARRGRPDDANVRRGS